MRPRRRPRASGPSARFTLLFDAFSSREPVSTSLENAMEFDAFSSREPVSTSFENAMEVTRMLPDVVTFWHGPLDALRLLCLRSQVAAGHQVTVYSFEPLAQLPDGVGNSEAEAILPRSFAERLRPTGADGVWRDWTTMPVSDFFWRRRMAENAGFWLDADVLLLKPVEIDPAKPYFAWERPRQLGNSVLYLPAGDPIVAAFAALMRQDELTPDWLALRHRLIFALRRLRGSPRPPGVWFGVFGS